jgi:agmatinase
VFSKLNVVGFDIVELCPNPHEKSSDFLAAKLYYKMLSYKFLPEIEEDEEDHNYNSPFVKLSKFKDYD